MYALTYDLLWPLCLYPAVSQSDGRLKSPTDSVFLHMERIPHIQEESAGSTEINMQQSEYFWSVVATHVQASKQKGSPEILKWI